MKKLLLSTAAVLAVSLSFAGAANAAGKTFAMVPKLIGHPFYAEVEKGCEDAAKKLGVECLFTGSPQADEAEQARVIRDLITKGVDGLAIAPNNAASITPVIAAAKAKGIPVITFDSDAPKSESGRCSSAPTMFRAAQRAARPSSARCPRAASMPSSPAASPPPTSTTASPASNRP